MTGAQYDVMGEEGHLDHRHLELINGMIYEASPLSDAHAHGIILANHALLSIFGWDAWTAQVQCPMRLGRHSRPEPDVALIPANARQIKTHPASAALVVEVSQSTLAYDRGVKAPLYAAAGIPDYWIVNLIDRCVEVHRRPVTGATSVDGFRYGDVRLCTVGESIAPLAMPQVSIAVSDRLP